MSPDFALKANLGVVIRGSLFSLQSLLDELKQFCATHGEVDLVFTTVSVDKLYVVSKPER